MSGDTSMGGWNFFIYDPYISYQLMRNKTPSDDQLAGLSELGQSPKASPDSNISQAQL